MKLSELIKTLITTFVEKNEAPDIIYEHLCKYCGNKQWQTIDNVEVERDPVKNIILIPTYKGH